MGGFCGRRKAELSSQHLLFLFLIRPTGRGPNAQSCIQSRSRKVRPEQKITKASEKDAEKKHRKINAHRRISVQKHISVSQINQSVFVCVCMCLVNQLVIPDGFDQLSQLLLLTFAEKQISLERQQVTELHQYPDYNNILYIPAPAIRLVSISI